jgi:hypothetical protein
VQNVECGGCCLGLSSGLTDLQEKLHYLQNGDGAAPRVSLAAATTEDAGMQFNGVVCNSPDLVPIFLNQEQIQPTIASYNASAVKICSATNRMARFLIKIIFL